jgi:hypothetical protein
MLQEAFGEIFEILHKYIYRRNCGGSKGILIEMIFLSALLATAWAVDISGTWKGSMDMIGQSMDLSFTFKADGNTLTRTTVGPQGQESPVSDGKIDGDKISFVVKTTGKMGMTIKYNGTLKGDEMTLKMSFDMPAMGGGPGGGPGGGGGMPPMPDLVLKKVE